MLRPDKNIQKLLISSTSRFVGEYESDNILITHAFPSSKSANCATSFSENPYCRNYYVVVMNTSPITNNEQKNIHLDYDYLGEYFCIYLAILFGKRFDYHGLFETNGFFATLDNALANPTRYPTMPINNHQPRKDLEIPLNLIEAKRLEPIFLEKLDTKVIAISDAAGRFYLRSVRLFETNPEGAFLDLVTCGEILSNSYELSEDELFDDELKKNLKVIEDNLDEGDKISKFIKSRLFQVKRRYTKTLFKLLNDYFFKHSESQDDFAKLKSDDIEKRIKASYDLRSNYVHNGVRIGQWLDPDENFMNEVQLGIPGVASETLQQSLHLSPTFLGLERIMRFCLLRYLHSNGMSIDKNLD